jgi:hypothetical protein
MSTPLFVLMWCMTLYVSLVSFDARFLLQRLFAQRSLSWVCPGPRMADAVYDNIVGSYDRIGVPTTDDVEFIAARRDRLVAFAEATHPNHRWQRLSDARAASCPMSDEARASAANVYVTCRIHDRRGSAYLSAGTLFVLSKWFGWRVTSGDFWHKTRGVRVLGHFWNVHTNLTGVPRSAVRLKVMDLVNSGFKTPDRAIRLHLDVLRLQKRRHRPVKVDFRKAFRLYFADMRAWSAAGLVPVCAYKLALDELCARFFAGVRPYSVALSRECHAHCGDLLPWR